MQNKKVVLNPSSRYMYLKCETEKNAAVMVFCQYKVFL